MGQRSRIVWERVAANRINLKELARREDGGLIIFTLFLLIMTVMVLGLSIDLMRSETDRARLQSTLDRAVLAGASLEQTLDSETLVRDYFEVAGLTEHLDDVKVIPGLNSQTVTATASLSTQSFFINMLGVPELATPAYGAAEESLSDIEISLVLDVSGSMGWWSSAGGDYKIDLLIEAANDFVYLMQCNPDDPNAVNPVCTVEPDTVSISIIPYSEQVSAGETLLGQFNISNEHNNSSCVDFEADDYNSRSIPLTQALQRTAELDPWTNYRRRSTSSSFAYNSRRSCRPWASREIQVLGNNYSDLQTFINGLTASGNTSIDIGMKWGVALLDPAFQTAANALSVGPDAIVPSVFSDRPYPYDTRGTQKVVVLMTDGENTSQYYVKPGFYSGLTNIYRNPNDNNRLSAEWADDYPGWYRWPHTSQWRTEPYGGSDAIQLTYQEYWNMYNGDAYEEAFWFLPDSYNAHGYTEKNSRLDAICAQAQAKEIEIFTIGFETSSASNAILQSCASSDAHHFDVNGSEMDNAFNSIAREIHELRLTN